MWVCLVAALLVIGLVEAGMDYAGMKIKFTTEKRNIEEKPKNNSQNWMINLSLSYFNLFATLLMQDNRLPSRSLSISCLFLFWYFYGIVIDGKRL